MRLAAAEQHGQADVLVVGAVVHYLRLVPAAWAQYEDVRQAPERFDGQCVHYNIMYVAGTVPVYSMAVSLYIHTHTYYIYIYIVIATNHHQACRVVYITDRRHPTHNTQETQPARVTCVFNQKKGRGAGTDVAKKETYRAANIMNSQISSSKNSGSMEKI